MVNTYPKIFISITSAIIAVAIALLVLFGLNLGASFTGGTSLSFSYEGLVDKNEIVTVLDAAGIQGELRTTSDGFLFSTDFLTEENRLTLIDTLSLENRNLSVDQYTTYGPSISKELVGKSIAALIFASVIIIFFVMYAFRKVSYPVSSFKYGIIALLALLHDMLVPLGVFVLLGLFLGVVIDELFVMALLATIGYSVNDTLVIFDRIREHLNKSKRGEKKTLFESIVNKGVKESIRRSVYTSLTTAIPLVLLFFLVPVVKWFALALFIGVFAGTYSSLFFAPSLLILWNRISPEKDKSTEAKSDIQKAEEELKNRLDAEGDLL